MTTDTTALLKLADRMKFACEGREQYAMGRPRLDSWVMIWQQELRELAAASPADGGVLPPLPGYGIDTANHASVRILGYTDEQMHAYAREALAAAAPDAKRSCAVSGSSWGLNCDETLSWGTHDKECALYNAKDEELPLPSDVEANVSNATEPDTPEEAAMFDIGRKAWAGVPDNWVSKIRGHEADATPYEPDGSDAPIRDATPGQGAIDGRFPAGISNPEAWPPNYANGYNDALQIVVEEGFATPQPTKPEANAQADSRENDSSTPENPRPDGSYGWPKDAQAGQGDTPESPEDIAEHFIQEAISRAPEPLRELGRYLSNALDEDEFATANRLLLAIAAATPPPARSSDDFAQVIRSVYHRMNVSYEGGQRICFDDIDYVLRVAQQYGVALEAASNRGTAEGVA